MEQFNYTDIVLAGIVILSALIGIARGLIKEVLSLVAWVFSIYIAWLFAEQVATQYVSKFISDKMIAYIAAFGLLFLVSLFAIGLLNLLISQVISSTGLSGFDRLLGMFFGILRGLLIAALLVFVADMTPIKQLSWWQQSKLVPGFAALGNWGIKHLPPEVRQWFHEGSQKISETAKELTADVADPMAKESSSSDAMRPNSTVSSQERNQISDMGKDDTGIKLESLDGNNANVTPADKHDVQQTITVEPPTLKLESVQ